MDKQLEQAYRAAKYCLWLAGDEYVLHIDTPATAVLDILTARLGLKKAAFILTPCNPRSAPLDTQTNRERVVQLRSRLKQDAIRWLPAVNRDPKGQWPDEPGALLIDCGLEYARALGQHYAQNAMLALGMDAIPRLVTL